MRFTLSTSNSPELREKWLRESLITGAFSHPVAGSVRDLAKRELEPLNRNVGEPLSITKLSDFVDRVYLPFAKQQKRPSTYRGYKQVWSDYLEGRCGTEWLREVKTHHVQTWLEEIAREHAISKTTLKHVKNFLSGVFRHPAQQGYLEEQTQ